MICRQVQDTVGGYGYEFADQARASKYACAECSLVAQVPQRVSCCNKRFCKSCLTRLRASTSQCSHCKRSTFTYMADTEWNSEIRSLKIYCSNKRSNGCMWSGKLKDHGRHLVTQCPLFQKTNMRNASLSPPTPTTRYGMAHPRRNLPTQTYRTRDSKRDDTSTQHTRTSCHRKEFQSDSYPVRKEGSIREKIKAVAIVLAVIMALLFIPNITIVTFTVVIAIYIIIFM